MFYGQFEYITDLQHKNKSLTAQLKAFRTGEKFAKIKEQFKRELAEKKREIRNLRLELDEANCRTVTVRQNYQQVIEDMEDEHKKALAKKNRHIKELTERALKAEGLLDAERDKATEKNRELYRVMVQLEEERGKNLKLKAQINRDYENSSIPSSMKPNRKKITNNREKTDRRPGGQPGHEGHGRKKHIPTNIVDIPAPEKYASSKDYRLTGKTITKQMVDVRVDIIATEYRTPEFRNVKTGQRVHADFPGGVVNDVNYGGSIKAFAFLLNNHCNVSIANVSDFLSELTGGKLRISTGMINGLSKEFSRKAEPERKKAFSDILLSPVMSTDFTTACVGGQKKNVMVCATPSAVIYFARDHKGHEGVKGTPVEDYQGILVHDHDMTFYKYGSAHQECLEHASRYLKDSMDNEPNLQWNRQMREIVREMIHFRNGLDPGDDRNPDQIDPDKVDEFEAKYDEVLSLAKNEYEYEPPNKYYVEGFNLYIKMLKYRDNHLLFLHDRKVPPTNNLSERLLRIYKRKQQQVMSFRSFESLEHLCNSLGVFASLRYQGQNLFDGVSAIFDLPANKRVS